MSSKRKITKIKKVDSSKADSSRKAKTSGEIPPMIVIMGASAGGLESLTKIIQNLKSPTGMAFVVIQHLDPMHSSALPEILQRSTSMPVCEVTHDMLCEANKLYTIPPNKTMTIEDYKFQLQPRPASKLSNMAIDCFMRSATNLQDSRLIGIVLSGSGSDGSIGLEEIKSNGGITFVQDPKTAQVDSMPNHAISTHCIDWVLAPEAIAKELMVISQHPFASHSELISQVSSSHDISQLEQIYRLVQASTNVDFAHYKPATIKRRIARRMAIEHINDYVTYIKFLKENPDEVKNLYNDFLIKVTQFFRDPEVFETLCGNILPELIKKKNGSEPLRIWVPGCSTGEEVYSFAICISEITEVMPNGPQVQIFGTDINEKALEKARAGLYIENISMDISEARLKRYFSRVGGHFQISRQIREMCVFAKQNIATDPPFSNIDLLSCRNLLIYFDQSLQRKVLPVFHYALRPNGFLVLGSSENIGIYSDLFNPIDRQNKIFSKRLISTYLNSDYVQSARFDHYIAPQITQQPLVNLQTNFLKEVEKTIGELIPGIVIDNDMNIVHFRGDSSRYVSPADGMASLNIFKMVKPELLPELRNVFRKAQKSKAVERGSRNLMEPGGAGKTVEITVSPFQVSNTKELFYVVMFVERKSEMPSDGHASQGAVNEGDEDQVVKIQNELNSTRDYLQSVILDHERANEELKAANEEILSSNEELQSTNEELETAKEELQSTNEELRTLNEELISKNSELNHVYNDLDYLFGSLDIPIIILTSDFLIRRFTPSATKLFRLIPTDIGRSIGDIRTTLKTSGFDKLLESALAQREVCELEVHDSAGKKYTMRVRPYCSTEDKVDGVVVTFYEQDGTEPKS